MKVTRNFTACWSVENDVPDDEYSIPTQDTCEMLKSVFKEIFGASHVYSFTVEDIHD